MDHQKVNAENRKKQAKKIDSMGVSQRDRTAN